MQATEMRQVCVEQLLLLGEGDLLVGGQGRVCVCVWVRSGDGSQAIGQAEGLLAGMLRGLEEGAEGRVGDNGVDGHGDVGDRKGREG